ncbi:heme NO-binding domain-containing protein [Paracoccus beibuensis]|uniref:heme NO-binding domain-containing protein n=1 Tax=Paracoccus beibuensis TaxID=547602 RepID=UPI00223F97C6|nr:heme NO-binding domain-containing protein [Paracoccus beibuensis]
MNRLVNRAIEEFLRSTYGEELVQALEDDATAEVRVPDDGRMDTSALARAAKRLSKPFSEMLEDMGAWMTRIEPIRRLLRFSGRDFKDFLLRMDELPGRANLVLPMLPVPRLQVETSERGVRVMIIDPDPQLVWQFLFVGLIRGMADDFGALCLITNDEGSIRIDIWDEQFSEGRLFCLQGAPALQGTT